MPSPQQSPPSFSRFQRLATGLNTFLAIAAVLALVVMANYLAAGYFKRYQLSRDAAFKLSPQTVRVIDSLTNDVTITIFLQPTGQNAGNLPTDKISAGGIPARQPTAHPRNYA